MSKPAYLIVDAKSSDPQAMARYRELAQVAVERRVAASIMHRGSGCRA